MAATILFKANHQDNKGPELWLTNGTTAGTSPLKDSGGKYVYAPLYLTSLGNGEMVFSAYDTTHGQELWVTDGTPRGTTLLVDIAAGSTGSSPGGDAHTITYLGNATHKALFTAEDGSGNGYYDVWVTDGTAGPGYTASPGHTYMLTDTADKLVPYNTHDIVALGNGKALFDASDSTGNYGDELWVTDGTNAGTHRISDIYAGFPDSNPRYITPIGNGKALFSATDGNLAHGYELWVTDGTTVQLVKDINPAGFSSPHHLTPLGNGEVVFSANPGSGYQLYVTNGTVGNASAVLDNNSAKVNAPYNFAALGNGTNKAVFASDDGVNGTELWVTDGISGGGHTYMIDDIVAGAGSSMPHDVTALGNGKALFASTYLFITDGTPGGTTQLTSGSITSPLYITPIGGGEAVFQATYRKGGSDFENYGTELFITNGTAAGTHLVKNIYPDGYGSGGIVVTTNNSDPSGFSVLVPCYCRGTLIRTENGEVSVEALKIGDRLMTLSGSVRPIKWIGRRAYDPRFVAGNRTILPIRIEAGALAHGVPARDLWVSPEHALYLRDVLVPAGLLVNDATITQPERALALEYFHIDLGSHDLILAERTPAESFVDCDNRAMFHNSREFAALYPDDMPARWEFCARRIEEGSPELAEIRAGILARAELFGRFTDDPDLHLVVDGAVVRPQLVANRRVYRFAVPGGGRSLAIASRSTVPMKVGGAAADSRRLGVAVESIALRGAGLVIEIGHDCAALGRGFHEPEAACRWTDGNGHLPAGLLASFAGGLVVEVHLAETEFRYGMAAAAGAATPGARTQRRAVG